MSSLNVTKPATGNTLTKVLAAGTCDPATATVEVSGGGATGSTTAVGGTWALFLSCPPNQPNQTFTIVLKVGGTAVATETVTGVNITSVDNQIPPVGD